MEERKIIIKVNQLELEVEIDCSELADLLSHRSMTKKVYDKIKFYFITYDRDWGEGQLMLNYDKKT